jgi:hypothetical protein
MVYIFTLLSLLFLQILSFKEIKPKLCLNCKYFITDNNTGQYGRCLLFPKGEDNRYRLVNGNIIENKNEYNYCVTAREVENMCGLEGKKYKKKYTKKEI